MDSVEIKAAGRGGARARVPMAHRALILFVTGFFILRTGTENAGQSEEKGVDKLKRWVFLSIAGALAVLFGGRILEGAALDQDNMGSR